MIYRIPFKIALHTLLLVLCSTLVIHILVLIQIIPYEIVWGGLLQSVQEMVVFELISIFIILILLVTLLIKGKYLKVNISDRILNVILWVYIIIFSFNTIGNLFAKTSLETILFTPLTILAVLLCYRITKTPFKEIKQSNKEN